MMPGVGPGRAGRRRSRHPTPRARGPTASGPRRRGLAVRAEAGPAKLTGMREELEGGTAREVWGFDLGATDGLTLQALEFPATSELVAVAFPLPMGIVFGERILPDGGRQTFVDELTPEGNGAKAGVRAGDVLKACTCVFKVAGQVDELAFYGNPPKDQFLPGVFTAKSETDFGQVMNALKSHTTPIDQPGGGPRKPLDQVSLILERPAE